MQNNESKKIFVFGVVLGGKFRKIHPVCFFSCCLSAVEHIGLEPITFRLPV